MISWEKLSHDHANGNIIKYVVCYQLHSINNITCSVNETIPNVETTIVTLKDLNEASTYNVAVKAATFVGFGKLGSTMNGTTLEGSKCRMHVSADTFSFEIEY